jgi:hypothetical protein
MMSRFSEKLRRWLTSQRLAQVAIALELVIVARALGEIYRLRAMSAAAFTLDAAMIWLTGALLALAFLALSVGLYFAGRDRLAGLTAVAMVIVLIIYKALAIGLG